MNRAGTRLLITIAAIGIAMLSCKMVKLDPGAEAVHVLPDADSDASEAEKSIASTCKELGSTRVSVLARAGLIKRNPEKVAAELDKLASNAALDLGGNAVVASGPVEDGERRYRVLRCPSLD